LVAASQTKLIFAADCAEGPWIQTDEVATKDRKDRKENTPDF
jgi:hypothetical protein